MGFSLWTIVFNRVEAASGIRRTRGVAYGFRHRLDLTVRSHLQCGPIPCFSITPLELQSIGAQCRHLDSFKFPYASQSSSCNPATLPNSPVL